MTHNEIYTKFMIEYDKANVTSSYPSLTKYEVNTMLDKAYLALISRKLTGNNIRRTPFEYDTKSIEDLRSLITTSKLTKSGKGNSNNEYLYDIKKELMYFIEGLAKYTQSSSTEEVILINHKIAQNFKQSSSNLPWIKNPVVYLEGDKVHLLIDPYKHKNSPELYATYIKKPKLFVEDVNENE